MADPRYEGSIFGAMQDKDPGLFAQIEGMGLSEGCEVWWTKYPEDLPDRGATPVALHGASLDAIIKPKR